MAKYPSSITVKTVLTETPTIRVSVIPRHPWTALWESLFYQQRNWALKNEINLPVSWGAVLTWVTQFCCPLYPLCSPSPFPLSLLWSFSKTTITPTTATITSSGPPPNVRSQSPQHTWAHPTWMPQAPEPTQVSTTTLHSIQLIPGI